MTQAFCHLVLHYSVARLSWKTVKSLRAAKRRSRLGSSTPTTNKNDGDVSTVEFEILQGWTILAFHSLYVSLRVEYFVRFIIPFYFHLKMLVLIVTFVIPSWNGDRGDGSSEFGLSPVISYWFDYLIVPGVHKLHDFMDHDPKGWARKQMAMMPLLIIDLFVLPGVLATEEEKQLVRKKRSEEIMSGEDTHKVPPLEAFPQKIGIANLSSNKSSDRPMLSDERTTLGEVEDDSQSATGDTDAFRNVSYIQDSFARKYRKQKAEDRSLATQQPDDSESIHRTPPRGQKQSSLFNDTTPTRTTPNHALSPSTTSKKSFNSILSPAVKSRLASSAMTLRRISREHRRNGGLLSPNTTPRRGYKALDADGDNLPKTEATIKIMESPLENETKASPCRARRKRRERLSLGDHFRELVTGDANIRVRDHLFDLDLPASPRRHLCTGTDKENLLDKHDVSYISHSARSMGNSSNITTRRSSRLAKNRVSSGD